MLNYAGALAHFSKITYTRYKRLRAHFTSFEELWQAEVAELTAAGLPEGVAYEFIAWREKNNVEKITEQLARHGIRTISIDDSDYPSLLSQIPDPPHTLFVRGILPSSRQPSVAVVGTRSASQYGRQAAHHAVTELAAAGVAVISGLALGIDGIAHQAALDAGGLTVAVLGSGVDTATIYPAAHRKLAEDILAAGGAIITEYAPGFMPTNYSFPARNRIIAGLTLGTLVVEAPVISGALITARAALDYNREVFAIPHPITSENGAGGNKLIQQGALLVETAADILEALQITAIRAAVSPQPPTPTNATERALFAVLSHEPQHIDALIKKSELPSAEVMSCLTILEMHGTVKNIGNMTYRF